jgi:hypothetical protein
VDTIDLADAIALSNHVCAATNEVQAFTVLACFFEVGVEAFWTERPLHEPVDGVRGVGDLLRHGHHSRRRGKRGMRFLQASSGPREVIVGRGELDQGRLHKGHGCPPLNSPVKRHIFALCSPDVKETHDSGLGEVVRPEKEPPTRPKWRHKEGGALASSNEGGRDETGSGQW